MSSELAIRARGLSKAYQIFSRPEDRLKQLLFGNRRKFYREFWALRDVDLEVGHGQTVGIVGKNGSGKSTLLQMICGTLTPTAGELSVHGRIAALLELGAGFNPEFTGRENVFLNAQILGLSRPEIEKRFDRIAAFADIGQYLEQPVKTYSSGMHARLAFAVAIHVDPEILVVDEALSVGDEAFQRKCFARIHQIRESGATILFVSHGAAVIVELCNWAILLDEGRRIFSGKPKMVIAKYQRLAYAPPEKAQQIRDEIRRLDQGDPADSANNSRTQNPLSPTTAEASAVYDPFLVSKSTISYSAQGAELSDAAITDTEGRPCNILKHGETYRYRYTTTFEKTAFMVRFGMMIKTVSGVELAGCATHPKGDGFEIVEKGQRMMVEFEFRNLLAPGTYFLNAGVLGRVNEEITWLHRMLDVVMFRVLPEPGQIFTGMINLMPADHYRVLDVHPCEETETAESL